jgi:hypothetical protein
MTFLKTTVTSLLEKLARLDVDAKSAEHAANLGVQYAIEARELLNQIRDSNWGTLSTKPAHVWKRRKVQLRQMAFKGCITCNGRGYIVNVPSSGVRATECACTKGK